MARTGADIVKIARECLGTEHHHQGRTLDGMDCIGPALYVAKRLGTPHEDVAGYARIPSGQELLKIVAQYGVSVPISRRRIGDVLVFWFDPITKEAQHLGIMTDVGVLHCLAATGIHRVVEHALTGIWERRICGVFRYPGVA